MTKEEKKYYWWLWAVKLFGKLLKVFTDKTVLSPKHWRVYYDEGLRPYQALIEDFKNR